MSSWYLGDNFPWQAEQAISSACISRTGSNGITPNCAESQPHCLILDLPAILEPEAETQYVRVHPHNLFELVTSPLLKLRPGDRLSKYLLAKSYSTGAPAQICSFQPAVQNFNFNEKGIVCFV